jgi:uncharacterized protein YggE
MEGRSETVSYPSSRIFFVYEYGSWSSEAIQTAVALASYKAEQEAENSGMQMGRIIVRDEHFQIVFDRRRDYVAYRKSIRNQHEDARAYDEGSRAMPKKTGGDEYARESSQKLASHQSG